MKRRTPRATRHATLFPDTTLVRSTYGSRPASTHFCRSMPIERMLRTVWNSDSSYEKYNAFSPREHAASTILAATELLPAPATPDTRMLEPRWNPPPLSIASRSRSEEHTSELQSLMRHSYAVICLT